MKKHLLAWFILTLCVSSLFSVEVMKLSDIRVGMEGTGKTIFKGTKIETFTFKVLGFIEKFAPDKDLIIVELNAPELEGGGVIAGMSGSPVYIDGKIIGAVGYGFSFSRKPIAGVTPIEDILETSDYNQMAYSIDISNIKVEFDPQNNRNIANLIQRELSKRTDFSHRRGIQPIKLIASNKGMNPSALSYLEPVFTPVSSLKVTQNLAKPTVDQKLFQIEAADAAAIPLIRGDFEYSASGTVSYVDGNKVYLFGHPFFNLGTVDFPLHKAEIVSVVPSFESSFRLTASKNMIGSVVQDRFSAIQGELGLVPYMIPMKVFLKNRNRKFELEMVNHPLLTPALSAVSLENIFISEYQQVGFNSITVDAKIFIEGEQNIILRDMYSGTSSFGDFSNLLLAINFFLMNNKEKRVKIQKMDFEISGSELVKRTQVENVIINKNAFTPGELIDVKLFFKNERGNLVDDAVQLKAPSLKPGSTFYLMVADKDEMARFDAKNIKSNYFPIKLKNLIRAINNIRKNNRVYFKLLAPAEGLFINGHEYSNLPLSMRNVFIYNSSSGEQSEIKYSTLMEYQMEVPAVVTGKKLFKLKIKEK